MLITQLAGLVQCTSGACVRPAVPRRCLRHPSFSIANFLPTCKCHLPLSVCSNSARVASTAGALCKVQPAVCARRPYATASLSLPPLRVRLLRVVCYRLIGLIVKMTKITSSAVTLRRFALLLNWTAGPAIVAARD